MKKIITLLVLMLFATPAMAQQGQYLGQYTINKYTPHATMNPQGAGNPYGNDTNSPKLYTQDGQFRGNLNNNRYDPNSVANPYGRYGSQYSNESINNPYGAGSPYNQESPYNPYGHGLKITD